MPIWLPRPFKIMAKKLQNRIEEMNTVDFYGRIKADSAVNPECLAAEECPSCNYSNYSNHVYMIVNLQMPDFQFCIYWIQFMFSAEKLMVLELTTHRKKSACPLPKPISGETKLSAENRIIYLYDYIIVIIIDIIIVGFIIITPVTSTAVNLSIRSVVHCCWVKVAVAWGACEAALVPVLIMKKA